MRRIAATLFFASTFSLHLYAQDGLYQISKDYFRSNALSGQFSSFLQHLVNDPDIHDKELQKRTDTTLFSFFGVYKKYNPFFFRPKRVDVWLKEKPIRYADSVSMDTILVYQISAYASGNADGQREIKKEFDKIHRQYHKKFYKSNYQVIDAGEKVPGELHNYFVTYSSLAPVTIAWGEMDEEFVLQITLRLKPRGNKTTLAIPPDEL